MIMDPTTQRLFDTYGEAILKEMGHGFDERQLEKWLCGFPMHEKVRFRILDGLMDYYQHWAAASFFVGLHLGLSLLNDNVRCPRPQER